MPSSTDSNPRYDISSIHLSDTRDSGMAVNVDLDSYSGKNLSFRNLLQYAYGVREDLILGGPQWARHQHFDVRAKILGADSATLKKLSPDQRKEMLREVLVERFKLTVHTELHSASVYELQCVKGGTKLKQVGNVVPDSRLNGVPVGGVSISGSELTAHDVELSSLTSLMAYQLHRTVIDKTGLTGRYDILLTWDQEDAGLSDSSLMSALPEQLGLKLVSSRGPEQYLVIDHAELPTGN